MFHLYLTSTRRASSSCQISARSAYLFIDEDDTNIIAADYSFARASTSSILVSTLITSVNSANHYGSFARVVRTTTCAALLSQQYSRSSMKHASVLKMKLIRRPRRSMTWTKIERLFFGSNLQRLSHEFM